MNRSQLVNIGPREPTVRKWLGFLTLASAVILAVALLATDLTRWWREPRSREVRGQMSLVSVFLVAGFYVLLLGVSDVSPASAQTSELETSFEFTFDTDAEGWNSGFADLPADFDQDTYELDSGLRELPEGLVGNGFYIQGHNRSDDIFMYLARQVDGLQPSNEYQVTVEIDLATNVPAGLFGIGGSPGESVYVKAGASVIEPSQEEDASGWLRSNVDKGNQANGGTEMVVLGNVSHSDVVGDEFRIKTLTNEGSPLSVTVDANGSVWLIVGTDSGFEGLTALYYSRISYKFVAIHAPSVAMVTGTITYRERIALSPEAVIEVKLLDVSRADAPAITIGEQIIENPGQVPVSFEIEYTPADIDSRFTYVVQARITQNEELAFITDTRYSVITRDSPTHVDMVLIRVGGASSEPSTPPDVGGMALSDWLLAVITVISVILVVLGGRALTVARRSR